jgi:hypothetical protein
MNVITLVNALVAVDLTRISARVPVVELAQTGGVEMRRNAQHPSGGNGVQRLVFVNILAGTLQFSSAMRQIRTKLRVWSRSTAAIFDEVVCVVV